MTVYLGTHGQIELQRVFDATVIQAVIKSGNNGVNTTAKRFFLAKDAKKTEQHEKLEINQLITGDEIQISSKNKTSALTFISGITSDTSIKKFVHIDELGGVRLYSTFAHAVTGGTTNALSLAELSSDLTVNVTVESARPRLLAQVNSFEINTERETVDTTVLSDEFRSRVNTLISGSGRISAFWEYTGDTANELPMYLYQLTHRTQVGSNFKGRFYLKKEGYNPSGVTARNDDEIWWDVQGVITAAAVQFSPDSTVQITADFVTTGEIEIKMSLESPDDLVQETGDEILLDLEEDSGAKLQLTPET